MFLIILSILITTFITWLFVLNKNRFNYWKIRGVPSLDHHNFIFGDFFRTFAGKEHIITTIDNAYKTFKSRGYKFGGIYSMGNPMLLVTDPEMVRSVLVKDFEHFSDRGVQYDAEKKPLSAHLFNLDGEEWKFIRKKLSPTFTTGKVKTMTWIIDEKNDHMCEIIKRRSGEDIYFSDLIQRTGMDIIGEAAFGLKCNTLENEVSPFYLATNKVLKPKINRILYYAFANAFKNHANLVLLISDLDDCNDFFLKIVTDAIKHRKDNNVRVNDFLQQLIDLMEPNDGEEGLSLEKITAQVFVFFVAAYETTARSVNLAMYELAKDMDLQRKLREDILKVLKKYDGTFSYEMVMSSELLDMVVKENFRKNSPGAFIYRICTQSYKIPDSNIVIEKGCPIIVPVYSIHNDSDNFPTPEKIDPYRFSKENESNIKPHTLLHFGDGPRFCIGSRLGIYQVKLSIMKLLKIFEISVSPKTEEPLTLNPITENFLLDFKQKIYLNFKVLDE